MRLAIGVALAAAPAVIGVAWVAAYAVARVWELLRRGVHRRRAATPSHDRPGSTLAGALGDPDYLHDHPTRTTEGGPQ